MMLSIVLIAELIGLAALVHSNDRGRKSALEQYYDAPDPLPAGAPGRPIRVWELSAPGVNGRVFGMLYHSESVPGRDISVSGFFVVPGGAAPAGGFPVVAVGHGTVGGADACAPSRDPEVVAATINPFLDRGWLVVATDFEGIGGTGRHPYLVGESEARSTIDSVRAARSLVSDSGRAVSNRFMAWGISQGGHAALFVRQLATVWAPELKLIGAVAVAPVSDVAAFVSAPTITPQAVTLLTVSGYTAAYPRLRADQVLTGEGLGRLDDVEKACLADLNSPIADMPMNDLRRADPIRVPAWKAALFRNEAGRVPSSVPVMVVQGTSDPIVPYALSKALARRLCTQGALVRLDLVAGASHGDIVDNARSAYLAWMDDRVNGVEARSTCVGV